MKNRRVTHKKRSVIEPMHKNFEGYSDPTAAEAINNIYKYERKQKAGRLGVKKV